MSWQASSLALLALALAAGFAWYEREKPPARVLAVVAALAALAVVGRLAFAAFPNVKPTTDIVLFAGYALGAVPGFAVGAVTAIVSNIFLSQGPWTVWQMAGWGAVGVGGALLARVLRGREPNRLGARCRVRAGRSAIWCLDGHLPMDLRGASGPRHVHRRGRHLAAVQHRPRGRERGVLPAARPRLPARARPLPAPPRGALGAHARADRGRAPSPSRWCSRCRPWLRRRHARPSAPRPTCCARRTRTAASAPRRRSARARSTPAGPVSGSARRAATRAT